VNPPGDSPGPTRTPLAVAFFSCANDERRASTQLREEGSPHVPPPHEVPISSRTCIGSNGPSMPAPAEKRAVVPGPRPTTAHPIYMCEEQRCRPAEHAVSAGSRAHKG